MWRARNGWFSVLVPQGILTCFLLFCFFRRVLLGPSKVPRPLVYERLDHLKIVASKMTPA